MAFKHILDQMKGLKAQAKDVWYLRGWGCVLGDRVPVDMVCCNGKLGQVILALEPLKCTCVRAPDLRIRTQLCALHNLPLHSCLQHPEKSKTILKAAHPFYEASWGARDLLITQSHITAENEMLVCNGENLYEASHFLLLCGLLLHHL